MKLLYIAFIIVGQVCGLAQEPAPKSVSVSDLAPPPLPPPSSDSSSLTPPTPSGTDAIDVVLDPTRKREGEVLSLGAAVSRALKNNPNLMQRRYSQEQAEINYDRAWATMYLPRVTLGPLSATSEYTAFQVPRSAADYAGKSTLEHGTPSSSVTIFSVGAYTIYNFGRDYENYKAAKLTYERSKETIHDVERNIKFDVIQKYFRFKTAQDNLEVATRAVASAQAVYELVKSRIPLQKATETDRASAEVDLLNLRNNLISVEKEYSDSNWVLNIVLGDPIGSKYNVSGSIKYKKFQTSLEDLQRIYKENSPSLKDAKLNLELQTMTLSIARKNALPLPTITFSGLQVLYTLGPTQSSQSRTTSQANTNGNLNFQASVNFSIPILGPEGFFRSRDLRMAEISVEQAELSVRTAANDLEYNVRKAFSDITQQERIIQNNEKRFLEASHVFEGVLATLQGQAQVSRLEMKSALEQLQTAESDYIRSIVDHYNQKVSLAQLLGIDHFPGTKTTRNP